MTDTHLDFAKLHSTTAEVFDALADLALDGYRSVSASWEQPYTGALLTLTLSAGTPPIDEDDEQ